MRNAKKFDAKMLAIWLIVLATFMAVVFLLPIVRNTVFYIAFAMTLFSFCMVAFAYVQSFLHDDTLSSRILGFPIFRVSLVALAFQLVVFMLLATMSVACPVWLAVIVEGLMLMGTSVCLIVTEAARSVVGDAEAELDDKTHMIKKLRERAAAMVALQEDALAKAEVEKLAQALRYADPISSEATKGLESKIEYLLAQLGEGATHERIEKAKRALALIQQRSVVAKSSK